MYFETSALTGHGLSSPIEFLVRNIMEKVEESVIKDFVPAK